MRPREFKIPSEFKYFYQFFGVVHPLRANVALFDLGMFKIKAVFASSSFDAFLELEGQNGEFVVHVHTKQTIEDIYSFRNLIKDHIDSRINLIGFYQGTYYMPEIVSCKIPDGSDVTFGVELRALKELAETYIKRVQAPSLMCHKSFPYLSRALRYFKLGMQTPLDTHFFIFRAIEAIRIYYAELNSLNMEIASDKKKSWEIMNANLGYQREDFKFLEKRAIASRHGQVEFVPETEIVECLKFGWKFCIKFIEITFGSECVEPPEINTTQTS